MSEKVSIVTGANSGIGFETALGIARKGVHVVMACRSEERGATAMAKLKQQYPEASAEVMALDLAEPASIEKFSEVFAKKHEKLNLLVNNAGIYTPSLKLAESGVELQFATNHLGHFALTQKLIGVMPNDSASRIVSVSSLAHRRSVINYSDINCEGAAGLIAYGQSKLANLLFADELDRRLRKAGKKLQSLAAHPGVSVTGIFEDIPARQRVILKLLSPFIMHSNASGAAPILQAALDPDAKGGDYLGPQGFRGMKGRPGPAQRSDYAADPAKGVPLWELSEKLTGIEFKV